MQEDPFVTIPPGAQARQHLTMIVTTTALYAIDELDGKVPAVGVSDLMSYSELLALMQKMQTAASDVPIPLSEREFVLMHGCCLLSSRLLLHEGGERLLEPFVNRLRTERPEVEMNFEKLRHYVLIQNEQMAKLNERAVQAVPSMREMQEAIEALSF